VPLGGECRSHRFGRDMRGRETAQFATTEMTENTPSALRHKGSSERELFSHSTSPVIPSAGTASTQTARKMAIWDDSVRPQPQLALNRVSDNVGGVKHFLGILVRALRKSAPFRSR